MALSVNTLPYATITFHLASCDICIVVQFKMEQMLRPSHKSEIEAAAAFGSEA